MSAPHQTLIKVWDLPTRLFHWLLVGSVAALWISGELGQLNLHILLGQWVLVLVGFRLLWGLVGSQTARFSDFVSGPAAIRDYLRKARAGTVPVVGHNPLGALSVLALLALVTLQAGTGLFTSDDIASEGPLAALVSSKTVSLLSSVHRIGFKLLLVLVGLHVLAVVVYRLIKKENLVLPMITGRKPAVAGTSGVKFVGLWRAIVALAISAAVVLGGISAVAG